MVKHVLGRVSSFLSFTIPDTSNHINEDFDQDSISSHKLELVQFQTLDKFTNFSFNEIEHECEYDPDSQPYDSVPIFESMLTLVSLPNLDQFLEPTFIYINLKIESPSLDSHIPLMEKECEFQFYDLDSTLEPKLTLEPKVDFPELLLVPEPIILEPKSTIPPSHILLLDIGIDHVTP